MTEVAARLEGITRRFGRVEALAGADLTLRAGEVHGVLGANGAGKTTLFGVLGGVLRPDSGTLAIAGRPVELSSPRDAWAHGVALVHQHFTLVPALSVIENLALGRRVGAGLSLDLGGVRDEATALMDRTGLVVPLEGRVEELGVGDRQRIEILKALLRSPRVLVLDEPTAVLAPSEIVGLFALLRELASEGCAIALVAHKLDEVLGVADHITVLRGGRTVWSGARAETSAGELVRAMVGGDGGVDAAAVGLSALEERGVAATGQGSGVARAVAREGDAAGSPVGAGASVGPAGVVPPEVSAPIVARLENAHGRGAGDGPSIVDVSLTVARGEIVGIAGIDGNGQHQLALLLSGRARADAGSVTLPEGIGYIPQDRSTEGVIPDFDLTENVALARQRDGSFSHRGWMRWGALASEAEELRTRYDVAAPGVTTRVGALSGGNQQRVVVGRELSVATDLLVAENPTRGLDVASTLFVHAELRRLTAADGARPGVVLISTDLDEVLALCGRIFAMSRGRLLPVPDAGRTREGVGALMLAGADA